MLIVDDPDAPVGTFDHWIVWNIPPNSLDMPEGAKPPHQGTNGFGIKKYRGPCPPKGKAHRYFFKLYALNIVLDIPEGSDKASVEKAMKGHVLENAQFIGLYERA